MRCRPTVPLVLVATLTAGLVAMTSLGQAPGPSKKVALVELFTSHG